MGQTPQDLFVVVDAVLYLYLWQFRYQDYFTHIVVFDGLRQLSNKMDYDVVVKDSVRLLSNMV